MANKFMIVKPTPCCNNISMLGVVLEHTPRPTNKYRRCHYCGDVTKANKPIPTSYRGLVGCVEEYRIIWPNNPKEVS
jgi:hypothetical protein